MDYPCFPTGKVSKVDLSKQINLIIFKVQLSEKIVLIFLASKELPVALGSGIVTF